jgi:hypothetical protein
MCHWVEGTFPSQLQVSCDSVLNTLYCAMGRFHFDVRYDGQSWSEDAKVIEATSPKEARQEAVELALWLAKEHLSASELVIRVRDDALEPLASVRGSAERSRCGPSFTLQFT